MAARDHDPPNVSAMLRFAVGFLFLCWVPGCASDRVIFADTAFSGEFAHPVAAAKRYLERSPRLRAAVGGRARYQDPLVTYETDPYRCTLTSRLAGIENTTVEVELRPVAVEHSTEWRVERAILHTVEGEREL